MADTGFDHMTLVVTDLDEARGFFGLLGFRESQSVEVSGETMAKYMGIPGWQAQHVTLALDGARTHQEVQLLEFHDPPVQRDPEAGSLSRTGFNHVCFRVEQLEEVLSRLASHGIATKNEIMTFHDRRLVFVQGPSGVTVELAEWLVAPGGSSGD